MKFWLKDYKIYLNSIKFQITITYIMWIMDNCKRTYKKVCWSTFTLWSGQNLMSIKWSKSEKPILLLKSVISTQYLDKNGENFVKWWTQHTPTSVKIYPRGLLWIASPMRMNLYYVARGITCPAKINIMTFSQKNKKRKRHKITRVMSLKST